MNSSRNFPDLVSAFHDGLARGLHTALQVYVSVDGKPLLDDAFGEQTEGRPASSNSIMPWRSAGKPLTALLILKRIEEGRLQLSTKIAEVIPEAAESDKSSITMLDLLSHQSGFPLTETGWPEADWKTSLERVLRTPCQMSIGTAAYHPQSSWFVLGEVLRRLEPNRGVSFVEILKRDLLTPLGLEDVFCGIEESRGRELEARLPIIRERRNGQLEPSGFSSFPWLSTPSPGGNLRGPIRQLGRFYEMLLRRGRTESGAAFVSERTVEQMTTVHRSNQFDQTLQHVIDFGLGVIVDSKHHGLLTVPYGYGQQCSRSTFGHGGAQCSIAFCDPERKLVVAWATNGFCGEGQHQRRNRMINDAIFLDLKIV